MFHIPIHPVRVLAFILWATTLSAQTGRLARTAPLSTRGIDFSDIHEHPCSTLNEYRSKYFGKSLSPKTDQVKCGDLDNTRSLLMMVPDPERTGLGLYFDRSVEAVEFGAESENFLLDSFWFPWRYDHDPATGNPEFRAINAKIQRDRLDQPGLMIFRRTLSANGVAISETLLVWLIGEAPTSGLFEKPFLNAIRFQNSALAKIGKNKKEITILGPVYSGSLQSLASLIANLRKIQPQTQFHVASGTTTSVSEIDAFRRQTNLHSFVSMLHSDEFAKCKLLEFVSQQQRNHRLAVIAESNSAMTQTVNSPATVPSCEFSNHVALEIFYPRDLSKLRSEPDRKRLELLPDELQTPDLSSLSPRLELPPTFRGDQSISSHLAFLNSTVELLKAKRIRDVLILSSDILDTIYLAEALKAKSSAFRIFLLDSDLLILSSAALAPLEGTILVSTYRIPFIENKRMIPLPSRYEVGQYKAFQYLFNNQQASSRFFAGMGHPADALSGVPIWISILGSNSILPIRAVTQAGIIDPSIVQPSTGEIVPPSITSNLSPPWLWIIFASTMAVLCAFLAVAMKKLKKDLNKRWPVSSATSIGGFICFSIMACFFAFFVLLPFTTGVWQCDGISISIIISLMIVSVCWMIFSCTILIRTAIHNRARYVGLSAGYVMILGLSGGFRGIRRKLIHLRKVTQKESQGDTNRSNCKKWKQWWLTIRSIAWRPCLVLWRNLLIWLRTRTYRISVMLTFGMHFGVMVGMGTYLFGLGRGELQLTIIRFYEFTASLSPITPILLLQIGFCVHLYFQYSEWRLWATRYPLIMRAPADSSLAMITQRAIPDVLAANRPNLFRSTQHLRSEDKEYSLKRGYQLFYSLKYTFIPLSTLWVIFFLDGNPSSEDWRLDVMLFLFVLSSIVISLNRVSTIRQYWKDLRGLLRLLERHRIREAFGRIPKQYTYASLTLRSKDQGDLVNRSRSLEQLELLVGFASFHGSKRYPRFMKLFGEAKKVLDELRQEKVPHVNFPAPGIGAKSGKQALPPIMEFSPERKLTWQLAELGTLIIAELEEHYWNRPQVQWQQGWVEAAEDFLALRYTALVRYFTALMRIAFFDLAFNFVFLTVGLNSYPYIISSRIRWLLATLFLVIGFFISRMLQQFRNNPIFLRMSGRESSNWDPVLVQQLLLLGAVPFVVLLAFVYPRFGRWIIDMLVPITAVLNGK